MYINAYNGDDNFATSGATLLSDLDLQESYKAIDSVATGRIPSLFCGISVVYRVELVKTTPNCKISNICFNASVFYSECN